MTCVLGLVASASHASELAASSSDLAWLVWMGIAGILVWFMQAGLALLGSGLARAENAVNVIMKCCCGAALSTLGFWLLGYGLMFGANPSGWLGTTDFALQITDSAQLMHLFYQVTLAALAASIVSSAVAERMRFGAYLIGTSLTAIFIYPVYGAWVWNPHGWLAQLGFIDAAGSAVVHCVGGWTALGALLALGPRPGRFSCSGEVREITGRNLPLAALGACIVWFGCMGRNGGVADHDSSELPRILINTNLGACAGLVGALVALYLRGVPVLQMRTLQGALGGLVAITAGCKTMDPSQAATAGLVGGLLMACVDRLLEHFCIDDPIGAASVHGSCGLWGLIAAGIFHADAPFDAERLMVQLIGAFAALLWALPISYLACGLMRISIGLRASAQGEPRGRDAAEHSPVGHGEFPCARAHEARV